MASGRGPIPCRAPRDTVQAIRAAERRGDVLQAYDLVDKALVEHSDDLWLKHRAVLNLARSKSLAFATEEFERLGLHAHAEQHEEIASLRGRLSKDCALASQGASRIAAARESAGWYLEAFRRWGGYYAAINAATMMLVAGERTRACELARSTLEAIDRRPSDSLEDRYFTAASAAEAALVLGDREAARRYLESAAAISDRDYSARATTRRQLRLVCSLTGADPAMLDVLRPPACLYYVGHMVDRADMPRRFPPASEEMARNRLATAIDTAAPDLAVGSLACGTDILCAEILLDRGIELLVVLPVDPGLFKRVSVAFAGSEWEVRFDRCLERARHVVVGNPGGCVLDDVAIAYGARLAMGLTLSRAQALGAGVVQIALWDGSPPSGPAGTAADVRTWRRFGHPTIVVPPPVQQDAAPLPLADFGRPKDTSLENEIAILFADFAGYSRLNEEEYGNFREGMLRPVAGILNACGPALLHRNTWGDGLYLVFDDAGIAARCALQIRDHVAHADWAGMGISLPLSIRIGGHVGPLRVARDPITLQPSFSGPHVVRAARIEPIAPKGQAFVTEAFAASLAMSGCTTVAVEYVGRRPTDKKYGEMRLFQLDWAEAAP